MSEVIKNNLAERFKKKQLHNLYFIEGNRVDNNSELLSWTQELISNFLKSSDSRASLENHSDIEIITPSDKKKTYGPEHLEQIFKFLYYDARELPQKFLVLTHAGKISESQANKLLKTFEEPPVPLTIFLLNPSQSQLLPTISSRCVKIKLALSKEEQEVIDLDYNISFSELSDSVTKGELSVEQLTESIYNATQKKQVSYSNLKKIKSALEALDQDILYNAAVQSRVYRLYTCIKSLA